MFPQINSARQGVALSYWIHLRKHIQPSLFQLGAVFSPYVPHCGAGGATFSLVGILIVELCQSWQLVAHPWREAAKLGAVVLLFLASGTLPYVDNFELLGGLIFGILMSILLLPYVTFGRWHAARRRLLVLVSAPIILVTSVFIFYMFYHVQTLDQVCDVCQLINCVPYTKTMCNMTNLQWPQNYDMSTG